MRPRARPGLAPVRMRTAKTAPASRPVTERRARSRGRLPREPPGLRRSPLRPAGRRERRPRTAPRSPPWRRAREQPRLADDESGRQDDRGEHEPVAERRGTAATVAGHEHDSREARVRNPPSRSGAPLLVPAPPRTARPAREPRRRSPRRGSRSCGRSRRSGARSPRRTPPRRPARRAARAPRGARAAPRTRAAARRRRSAPPSASPGRAT